MGPSHRVETTHMWASIEIVSTLETVQRATRDVVVPQNGSGPSDSIATALFLVSVPRLHSACEAILPNLLA